MTFRVVTHSHIHSSASDRGNKMLYHTFHQYHSGHVSWCSHPTDKCIISAHLKLCSRFILALRLFLWSLWPGYKAVSYLHLPFHLLVFGYCLELLERQPHCSGAILCARGKSYSTAYCWIKDEHKESSKWVHIRLLRPSYLPLINFDFNFLNHFINPENMIPIMT